MAKVTKEEQARLDRIAVRAFLDHVHSKLRYRGYDEDGGVRYPGQQLQVEEKDDCEDRPDVVDFFIVTATEFKEWFKELAPERGRIDLTPKGSTHTTATGWSAQCDDCGIVAEGTMTATGHDDVVRAWFAHDKEKHGGDGNIPYHMMIIRDK